MERIVIGGRPFRDLWSLFHRAMAPPLLHGIAQAIADLHFTLSTVRKHMHLGNFWRLCKIESAWWGGARPPPDNPNIVPLP